MQKFLLVIMAVVLLANVAMAGDGPTVKANSGDKAWLFSFGGLSSLSANNFMGGIGGKYYISTNNAFRMSLGFTTNSTTLKNPTIPTPTGQSADQKFSSSVFSITPGFLHVMSSDGPVAPYIGAQFTLGMSSNTTENPGYVLNNKNHGSSTSFGVSGIAGVEWFPWSNVSFAAEYQLSFASSSGTNEVTVGAVTTTTDSPSQSGFGTGSTGSLTLAVYW